MRTHKHLHTTRAFVATLAILTAVVALATARSASAGTISIGNIPATGSDAGGPISNANTYTHALDFGPDGSGTMLINGVTFTRTNSFAGTDTTTGNGYAVASVNIGNGMQNTASGGTTFADGNTSALLFDFFHPDWTAVGQSYTLTLSGLTPGTSYSQKIYYRPFPSDPRTSNLEFDGDGTPVSQNVSQGADAAAHYVTYDFVANGTSVLTTFSVVTGGWHLYGVTNEVVENSAVPEPSTLALAMLGLVGLGFVALRKKFRRA